MKCIISSFMLCVLLAACSTTDKDNMLHIREQGSFLVGGSVVTAPGTYDKNNPTTPDGQALHGDHAYVFYQIPDKARCLPLVFLHGNGESAKTWETTPGWLSAIKNPHVCAIRASFFLSPLCLHALNPAPKGVHCQRDRSALPA